MGVTTWLKGLLKAGDGVKWVTIVDGGGAAAKAGMSLASAGKSISAGAVAVGGAIVAGLGYVVGGLNASDDIAFGLSAFDIVIIVVCLSAAYLFAKRLGLIGHRGSRKARDGDDGEDTGYDWTDNKAWRTGGDRTGTDGWDGSVLNRRLRR